jgi:hypothetical protein
MDHNLSIHRTGLYTFAVGSFVNVSKLDECDEVESGLNGLEDGVQLIVVLYQTFDHLQ